MNRFVRDVAAAACAVSVAAMLASTCACSGDCSEPVRIADGEYRLVSTSPAIHTRGDGGPKGGLVLDSDAGTVIVTRFVDGGTTRGERWRIVARGADERSGEGFVLTDARRTH